VPQPDTSKNVLVSLSWNKFGVEAFYDKIVTSFFVILAEILHLVVDVLLIDTLLVNGAGFVTRATGGALRRLQSGMVNLYAAGILLGALAVLFFLLRG
jgi:NADH:ubiquinone oxidoreductase subunit 5 (subunit L)/multisubunit Na+/H+ antiporter MnhA subunit